MPDEKVRLGKVLRWDEAALDSVSTVTDVDKQLALAAWQAAAPAPYQDLPLAAPADEEDRTEEILVGTAVVALSTQYVWDAELGIYVIESSQSVVAFETVRDIADRVGQAQLADMLQLSQRLQAGQISIAEWQLGMAKAIKIMHVNQAVLARGGWAQMSQADWGFVGSRIKAQYKYLNGFAAEIVSGKQALDGRLLVRTSLYEGAGRSTFEEMRRRVERLYNNMEEERRVLGPADHCPGCLAQAALQWQPIGTLEPIGSQECRTNCHCRFEFRRLGADGDWITSG